MHRPHQGDWSLPKGRLRRRESALACALREVREETGLWCAPVASLPEARYVDRKGRDRRVRYWSMQPLGGVFRANDEVDELRWLRIEHLASTLTHAHDLHVVMGLRVRVPAMA